jgi:hypothetical protein
MKTLKKRSRAVFSLFAGAALFNQSVLAEVITPPASPAEMEALYTHLIGTRTEDILKPLALTDAAKSNSLHDILISYYRVMRARDEVINAKLDAADKEINYANRADQLEAETKPLHDHFIAQLSKQLTPDQIEMVKDKMTYNKVKITADAYSAIVPGLTDTDKAKVLELLKAAREKAMDGGSATEKSAIFQVYKNEINDYLNSHGHDVAKAYKDWEAKQAVAKATTITSGSTNVMQ